MKAILKTAVIGTALMALSLGSVTLAAQKEKEPTKYDCRVVVGYRTEPYAGNKPPRRTAILACPHKDKLTAGECETSWIWGMRCKK